MPLRSSTEVVTWPITHYVYVEKVGPFMQTARAAWEALHATKEKLAKDLKVSGAITLYRTKPEMIYRAGLVVDRMPTQLPPGLQYVKFAGGQYTKFTVDGSYAQMPEASGKVWDIVKGKSLSVRDDFTIENYVNDPATTPEDKLITEILIPTN